MFKQRSDENDREFANFPVLTPIVCRFERLPWNSEDETPMKCNGRRFRKARSPVFHSYIARWRLFSVGDARRFPAAQSWSSSAL